VQNDQLNFTFTNTVLPEKVTKICSSSGDPVSVEVADAAGDKVTTGISDGEPVSRTGNVSCSCDGPGCSAFCLSGLMSGVAFVFVLLQLQL
jgi:hypothetical protein